MKKKQWLSPGDGAEPHPAGRQPHGVQPHLGRSHDPRAGPGCAALPLHHGGPVCGGLLHRALYPCV